MIENPPSQFEAPVGATALGWIIKRVQRRNCWNAHNFGGNAAQGVGKLKLRVAAIDELIKMKRLSDRPQDREDIKALARLK